MEGPAMPRSGSERGFTLVELMIASMITMVIMGVAFTTFQNALALNDAVVQLSDASQNLRAGTNLLVRDLAQAGRNLDVGGVPIPSGGAESIHRPSPPGTSYTFENVNDTHLKAITTGANLGPIVGGRETDMVTILTDDPYLTDLDLYASNAQVGLPKLAVDGASFDAGADLSWLEGDPGNGVAPIIAGDLLYFNTANGQAIQTVTSVESPYVYFDANDPFMFNQRTAPSGSITQILPPSCPPSPAECDPSVKVRRLFMFTYYVHEEEEGVPRLMRMLNHFDAQALAGVIEDLELRYDLVDGTHNPVNVADLPFTANDVTYSATQIRKVNVHVGVRSELLNPRTNDYLRTHVSTVIGIRNLAFVDRYQ
jgi:type II secretory pathway pseudopilin PulG